MSSFGRYWLVGNSVDEANFLAFLKAYFTPVDAEMMRALRDTQAKAQAMTMEAIAGIAPAASTMPKKRARKEYPYSWLNRGTLWVTRTRFVTDEEVVFGGYDTAGDITAQGIAVITISGFITKDGYTDWMTYSSVAGTNDICKELNTLGNDSRVLGIALIIDSGGGEARGTEELATTIRGFYARYKKRIHAYVDGTAGSAAYWIASAADRIVMVGNSSRVGSIGTMATIRDTSGMDKMWGISYRNVYATLSTEKNKDYEEAMKGNDAPLIQSLDDLNKVFVGDVIKGRYRNTYKVENLTPDNAPEQFKGAMYMGRAAVDVGLSDVVVPTKDEALSAFLRTVKKSGADKGNDAYSAKACDDDDDKDDDDEQPEVQTVDPIEEAKKRKMGTPLNFTPLKSFNLAQ